MILRRYHKEVKQVAETKQGNTKGQEIKEKQEKTKKEIIADLDLQGIEYNARDKKEMLLELLKK